MIRIGIDLDGVVIDSELTFRVYEEIYAIEDIHKKIIDREEPKYQHRYDWTPEERDGFNKKYLLKGAEDSHLMPGFKEVYKRLKSMDLELVVITARGMFIPEMKDDAEKLLEDNNIIFDGYYWNIQDKVEICKKENIDYMIDDDYHIIEKLNESNIKTLYFRHENLKKLPESDLLHEVNNWGDIYRFFVEL